MTTINGKSLKDVLTEIRQPSEVQPKLLQNKYPYYEIDTYEQRLNNVLGREHYIPCYGDIKEIQLSTGQLILTTSCKIEFIDDDGNICYRVYGLGSFEPIYSNDNATYIGLANAGYRTQIQAFKSACKSLQIFDIHGEECDAPAQSQSSAKKDVSKPTASVTDEIFYTTGMLSIIQNDPRSNKPIYKVYGYKQVFRDNTPVLEDFQSAIVFYPNQYKNETEILNQYISLCNDGKQHKILVKVSKANYANETAPQYIFKGFWR